jgi:hypothetical protein
MTAGAGGVRNESRPDRMSFLAVLQSITTFERCIMYSDNETASQWRPAALAVCHDSHPSCGESI